MAVFEVEGVNESGKTIVLTVEADTPKIARTKARQKGLTPIEVRSGVSSLSGLGSNAKPHAQQHAAPPVDLGSKTNTQDSWLGSLQKSLQNVSVQDLANMTRQLASLLKAHVPVVESLTALIEQIEQPQMRDVLVSVRQEVNEGRSLADGLSLHPKIFNRVYLNMVRAGESSGRLDVVLLRLADFTEGQVKLKNKVQSALTYPVIMIVVGLLAVGVIFVKVVPQVTRMFEGQKKALPFVTEVLIAISHFMTEHWLHLLIGGLATLLFLERYVATEAGRAWKDRNLLRSPVLGKILQRIAVARFSRTLGTLLSSGVPMLAALEITRNVVANWVYERLIDEAKTQVSEGRPLSSALRQTGVFPPIVIHMVGVGEKTGELESMLGNVAENYEEQVQNSLGTLTSLLEPILMLVMALVVGFIVMGVLLPIFEMQNFV